MFDMDGTLLDLHFDNYFWLVMVPKIYSEKHGISAQSALEIILAKTEKVRGTLNWYCLDYWENEFLQNEDWPHQEKILKKARLFYRDLK